MGPRLFSGSALSVLTPENYANINTTSSRLRFLLSVSVKNIHKISFVLSENESCFPPFQKLLNFKQCCKVHRQWHLCSVGKCAAYESQNLAALNYRLSECDCTTMGYANFPYKSYNKLHTLKMLHEDGINLYDVYTNNKTI